MADLQGNNQTGCEITGGGDGAVHTIYNMQCCPNANAAQHTHTLRTAYIAQRICVLHSMNYESEGANPGFCLAPPASHAAAIKPTDTDDKRC